ncbi:unnamed protein product, partial [Ectocarpus sp. 8 AP-2014]
MSPVWPRIAADFAFSQEDCGESSAFLSREREALASSDEAEVSRENSAKTTPLDGVRWPGQSSGREERMGEKHGPQQGIARENNAKTTPLDEVRGSGLSSGKEEGTRTRGAFQEADHAPSARH